MQWFKQMLDRRSESRGIWLSSGSHVAAEIAAAAGFDWALLDMEHGVGEHHETMRQIQVLSHSSCLPIVRVPSIHSEAIGRVLDFGVSAVMAPMVNSGAEAAALVEALRYPPEGKRGLTGASRACGYGKNFENYFRDANAQVAAIAQIETAEALDKIDEIAAVDGVEVLFIGHSDLALNLGCRGGYNDAVVRDAEEKVLAACRRNAKKAGMLAKAGMTIDDYRHRGFSAIAAGTDIGVLKQEFFRLAKA